MNLFDEPTEFGSGWYGPWYERWLSVQVASDADGFSQRNGPEVVLDNAKLGMMVLVILTQSLTPNLPSDLTRQEGRCSYCRNFPWQSCFKTPPTIQGQ